MSELQPVGFPKALTPYSNCIEKSEPRLESSLYIGYCLGYNITEYWLYTSSMLAFPFFLLATELVGGPILILALGTHRLNGQHLRILPVEVQVTCY